MRRRAQTLTVTKRVTTCSLATVVMVTVTMATTRCSDQTQKVKVLRWRITTAGCSQYNSSVAMARNQEMRQLPVAMWLPRILLMLKWLKYTHAV